MSDYNFGGNPRLVSYQLTEATYLYVQRMLELGAVEGPLGNQRVSPEVARLVEGIHAILAGGKATVTIESRGNPDIFNELNRRAAAGTENANEINGKAGYYVTLMG